MEFDKELLAAIEEVNKEVQAVIKSQKEVEELRKNVGPEDTPTSTVEDTPGEGTATAETPAQEATPEAEGMTAEQAVEALVEQYLALPPEELVIHYQAAKTAVFILLEQEEAAAGGTPTAEASPAGPGAGSPEASAGLGRGAGPEPAMTKAQMPANKENGGQIKAGAALGKAETEKFDKIIAKQSEQIEKLSKAIELIVGQPERKSVTGLDYLGKAEPVKKVPSRAEVIGKLNEIAQKPDLTKSDRDKITGYAIGTVDFSAVEHLLN